MPQVIIRFILILCTFLALPTISLASWDGGIFAGRVLPYKAGGIDDNLTSYGTLLGYKFERFEIESALAYSSQGAGKLTTLTLAYRYQKEIEDGVYGILLGGFENNWYAAPDEFKSRLQGGSVFGAGLSIALSRGWKVRADVRLQFDPGSRLHLLFAVIYQ